MPRIRTDDGVEIYFEEAGSGNSILFLHEFGGHHLSWEPQLRFFSRRYRCITYAARGWPPSEFQRSPMPTRKRGRRTTPPPSSKASALQERTWSGCPWGPRRRSNSVSAIHRWRCP